MTALAPLQPGLLLVHKPVGETSFSAVVRLRAEFEARRQRWKVCHGGTLDPFASGLLVLLVGPATRLFEHLHAAPKVYRARVRWGVETDNGDPTGKPVVEGDARGLSERALEAALRMHLGWTQQVPPPTSAKKVGGEPAYKKVHRGETVELPPCAVYLHRARWLAHDLPHWSELELTCRGGFYVRALVRDLGRALGCGAHLASLDRLSIGPWVAPPPDERVRVPSEGLLSWCSKRAVSDREVGDLRAGRAIEKGAIDPPDWKPPPGFELGPTPVRLVHQGRLLGLASGDGRALTPLSLFGKGL